MKMLTVITDLSTGTVLAACTALDGRSLEELVPSSLAIVVAHQELELPAGELRAHTVTAADAMAVLASPTEYCVVVTPATANDPEQVEFVKSTDQVTLDVSGATPKITVSSGTVLPRRAWVIVKKGTGIPQREPKDIPSNLDEVTFSIGISAGDVVIGLVANHRADMRIK